MRWHTVDYRKRDSGAAGTLLNRGFWIELPRLMLLCRLRGHRTVVDGTDSGSYGSHPPRRTRWVVCDRCGTRPDPQGNLDPDEWRIGQTFTGPFEQNWPTDPERRFRAIKADPRPGPWPTRPTGTIGGQLVLGKSSDTSIEIKIGNPGSEHVLAGHITVAKLFGLYLHAERHGRGLQRRLNPRGYESRITGLRIGDRRLWWHVWAKRDSWSSTDPKWQRGSIRVNLLDLALGERRYSYTNVLDPVTATVRLPHGDDHEVALQLQRQTLARRRQILPAKPTWTVDWRCARGIPTRSGGSNRITGAGVEVSTAAVEDCDWVPSALAAIATTITRDRARYGYRTPEQTTTSGDPRRAR